MRRVLSWLRFEKILGFLEKAPYLLFAMFLLLPLLIGLLGLISKKTQNKLLKTNERQLYGVRTDINSPPDWSWEEIFSGQWRIKVENIFNLQLPLRASIIRMHNQIYYDFFSKSYMHNGFIVKGKKDYLFEEPYIRSYCNPDNNHYAKKTFQAWTKEIEALQKYYADQGKLLIYLITPSKAAFYPEYLPDHYKCTPSILRPIYMFARSALEHSKLTYVDGSAIVHTAKNQYPHLLFPQGGTHWTLLAAALTTKELLKTIEHAGVSIPQLSFSYKITHMPEGSDRDLLELLNLMKPNDHYRVADLTVSPNITSANTQKSLKLALVGGSFLYQVIENLQKTNGFKTIDYYNYFDTAQLKYKKSNLTPKISSHDAIDYDSLLEADVVIIEENEQGIRSAHIRKMMAFLNNKTK